MKSTTFNMHKTRLTKTQSISNLILVGTIALILAIKVGLKHEKPPLRPFINRIRLDRVVKIFISFGRDFINFCLDNDEKLSFS